jgi:uncharacterized membrane protein (UPF0127 family)
MITRKSYFYLFVITSYISIIYSSTSLSNNPTSFNDLKIWGKGVVTVQMTKTENAEFRVVIAKSNKERRQGLMHIEFMEENEGMVFIFDPPRKVSMWMRNTPMTLDMIFINKDGEIITIENSATPYSTKGIPSNGSIKWVLEINGGLSERLNIKTGDSVKLNTIEALAEE